MHKLLKLSQQLKSDFEELLSKSIKDADWDKFSKGHNPEGMDVVDVSPYLVTHATDHPHYKEMLNSPEEAKAKNKADFVGTTTPKIVHGSVREDVPHVSAGFATYMVKPFSPKIKSTTKHHGNNPILGWATMAANGIFKAAGMGDNVEDVSVHQHKGIPVTIHRFNDDAITSADIARGRWQTRDADTEFNNHNTLNTMGKGAVLDFLMGNTDRHNENIMFEDKSGEGGSWKKPFYIDNERSFQYHKPLFSANPWSKQPDQDENTDYISTHAQKNLNTQLLPKIPEHEVRDWWDDHKHAIKNEFYKHIKNIKDPVIRNHIENNFNKRMEHVEDHLGAGVFSPSYGVGVQIGPKQRKPRATKEKANPVVEKIKKDISLYDPVHSLGVIGKMMPQQRSAVREGLADVSMDIMNKLTPDQIVAAYQKYGSGGENIPGMSNAILQHVLDSNNVSAKQKLLDFHKQGMVKMGLDPKGAVYKNGIGLPPYWFEKLNEGAK